MRNLLLVLFLILNSTDLFSATISKPRKPNSATTVHALTYTTVAGEYVKATVSYTVNAVATSLSTGVQPSLLVTSDGQKSGSVSFWLYTGQTITIAKTAANTTENFSGGSGTVAKVLASSSVSISIDGTNVDTIVSRGHVVMYQTSSSATITIGGEATGSVTIEHYAI